MTQIAIGSNIQAYSAELDFYKTLDFWEPLHSAAHVVTINNMNDKNRILEAQKRLKDSLIVARYVVTVKNDNGEDIELDGALHTKPQGVGDTNHYLVSPENYMNLIQPMGDDKTVLYWMNEPSGEESPETIERLIDHAIEGIKLGDNRDRSLCLINWGVGHPLLANGDTELHRTYDRLLIAIKEAKKRHYYGLHLYDPADTIVRLQALEGSCKRLGIDMPYTIVTEWGYDAGFKGDTLNGYKTRGDGLKLAKLGIDAVKGKLHRFFESGKLIAIIGFCEGGEPKQHNFNYTNDNEYKDEIKRAVSAGEISLPPPTPSTTTLTVPVVKLFPSDFEIRAIERWVKGKTASQYIRKYPYIAAERIDLVAIDGMRCDIIPAHALHPDEVISETINGVQGVWIPVKCNAARGWLWDGAITTEIIPEKTITNEVPKAEPIMPSEPVVMPQFPPMMPPVATAELPLATLQLMRKALQDQITVLDFYIGELVKAN